MKTRSFLTGFLGFFTILWFIDALILNPLVGNTLWVIRKNGIYLTGLWAITLMSLIMLLATRPAWLEDIMGGMDKIYRLHKWAGIWAILFATSHWLIKIGGSPLKSLIGSDGKPARDSVLFFMTPARSIAKDLGEWTVYFLIIALIVTLVKLIPYKQWHKLHKVMPIAYLILVFHTLALTPLDWWLGLTGLPLAILLIIGSVSCILILTNKTGITHQHKGKILNIESLSDGVLSIVCDAGYKWTGHTAGQFAFLKFDNNEGYHPFTIASAPQANSSIIEFKVKALGDYTTNLIHKLSHNQTVIIEGPYGRLNHKQCDSDAKQIWIAAGIGVTPFLSWLHQMQHEHQANSNYKTMPKCVNKLDENNIQANISTPIEFHYCIKNAFNDPFITEIKAMVKNLPNVDLIIHDSSKSQKLTVQELQNSIKHKSNHAEIWFCGPSSFAKVIRKGLKKIGMYNVTMHQEAFEMR